VGGILLGLTIALSACTGGGGGGSAGEISTSGLLTKIDTNAKTFSIQTNDGKSLDFRLTSSSKADINELKTHYDQKKPADVRYKTGTPPYEATYAD
jgi:hypothetical protein